MTAMKRWTLLSLSVVLGCAHLPAEDLARKLQAHAAVRSSDLDEAFLEDAVRASFRTNRTVTGAYTASEIADDLLKHYRAAYGTPGALNVCFSTRPGDCPEGSSNPILQTELLADPWFAYADETMTGLVFGAIGDSARRDDSGTSKVLPAPCFRLSVPDEGSSLAQSGVTFFVPPSTDLVRYDMPLVATTRRFAIGWPALDCLTGVHVLLRAEHGGDKLSGADVLVLVAAAPAPNLDLRFDDHPAAKEWAARLKRAPEIGLAQANAQRGFVILRDRDDGSALLVVPIERTEVDGATLPQRTWLASYKKATVYRTSGEPWVQRIEGPVSATGVDALRVTATPRSSAAGNHP